MHEQDVVICNVRSTTGTAESNANSRVPGTTWTAIVASCDWFRSALSLLAVRRSFGTPVRETRDLRCETT
eukprot:3938226-Rhodomonas_salina.2